MDQLQIQKIVAEKLNSGIELGDIQKMLADEHGVTMTFLDLRLLASELEDVDWQKIGEDESSDEEELAKDDSVQATATGEALVDATGKPTPIDASGKTVVEINKVARPGAVASGSVTFASGAIADWVLDQLGRLALDKKSGEPDENDLKEFQLELQKAIAGGGY